MRVTILLIEKTTCLLPQTIGTSQKAVIAANREFALQNASLAILAMSNALIRADASDGLSKDTKAAQTLINLSR